VVMILCTLSAIPGNDDAAVLNASTAFLKPGGAVLIRDHGLYDMRHLRDMQRDAVMVDHVRPAYVRPGGMHRRYYSLSNLDALAAGAGLQVEESRYLCIRQRNQKRGINMDRVYVHAVFRSVGGPTRAPESEMPRPVPPLAEESRHAAPAGRPAPAAYVNAIRSCGADGGAAVEILQQMTSTLGSSDMFAVSTALAVCGKGGDWRKALELFESISEPDVVSFHAVLSALQRSGRGVEAEEMLLRMSRLSIGGGNPGEAIDVRCFNTALKAYHSMAQQWARGGATDTSAPPPWSRSCNLLQRAHTLGVTPNAVSYALAAESCLEAGEHLRAKTLHAQGCALCGVSGAVSDAEHRVLSNLEARLWKGWSHSQLKVVLDLVLAEQEIKADSAAWEKLSSSL
jgi:hypothetical protein